MFAIQDNFVALAYLLCLISALICIIYGALNWNKGKEDLSKQDIDWAKEEKQVEEEL